MRTIKFRAFKNGKFIFSENYGLAKFFDKLMEFDKVQQYTGKKDKNGLEIYEGDILLKSNGHKKIIKEIKDVHSLMNTKLTRIIGNIYENPDLC